MTLRKNYLSLLGATAIVSMAAAILPAQEAEVNPSSLVDDLFEDLDSGGSSFEFDPSLTGTPEGVNPADEAAEQTDEAGPDVAIDLPSEQEPENSSGEVPDTVVIPGGTPENETSQGDVTIAAPATGLDLPMNSSLFDPDLLEVRPGDEYTPDPDGDPLTEQVTRILREGGLLQRQEEIGRSILLMDRQARFANSVGSLLSLLGPDAQIEVAPGVFQSFEDTRMGRNARIADLALQQEVIGAEMSLAALRQEQRLQSESFDAEIEAIVEARLDQRVEEERQTLLGDAMSEAERIKNEAITIAERDIAEANNEAVEIIENAEAAAADQRAEAEAYFNELTDEVALLRAEQQERLAALEERERDLARKEELIASIEIPGPDDIVPFSVSEIYGANGQFTAIINRGGQLVRVRPGDRLPDGPVVEHITATDLRYSFLGEEYRLSL